MDSNQLLSEINNNLIRLRKYGSFAHYSNLGGMLVFTGIVGYGAYKARTGGWKIEYVKDKPEQSLNHVANSVSK